MSGYRVVGTPLDVAASLPAQLTKTLRLERPSPRQILSMKKLLRDDQSKTLWADFENDWIEDGDTSAFKARPRKKVDWRYLILSFHGNAQEAREFGHICNVCEPPFYFLVTVFTAKPFGGGAHLGWSPDYLWGSTDRRFPFVQDIGALTDRTVEEMRVAFKQYLALKQTGSDIPRAVSM